MTDIYDNNGNVSRVRVRNRAIHTVINTVAGKAVINLGLFREVFTRIGGTDESRP